MIDDSDLFVVQPILTRLFSVGVTSDREIAVALAKDIIRLEKEIKELKEELGKDKKLCQEEI